MVYGAACDRENKLKPKDSRFAPPGLGQYKNDTAELACSVLPCLLLCP